MKTKAEFIERWRRHVAGVIALGGEQYRRIQKQPLAEVVATGEMILSLAEQTSALLSQLYDDLAASPQNNGKSNEQAGATIRHAAAPSPTGQNKTGR